MKLFPLLGGGKTFIINKLKQLKRRFYIWKLGLKHVDKTFLANKGASISKDFCAGAYSYVGGHSTICPKVTIGNFTMLAHDVMILGGDHNYKVAGIPTVFAGRDVTRPTNIGDDVWVGAGSIIMAGVKKHIALVFERLPFIITMATQKAIGILYYSPWVF